MAFAFTNIGELGEELALYIYEGSIGSASKGGCAFDNRTGDIAREIKTVSLNGSKICRECKNKAPFMQPYCIHCRSNDFKYKDDSRAGISASAHIKYYEKIKEYLIFTVKYDISKEIINVMGFKFDSSNSYFDKLIRTQKENGSDTCNFLPGSYDWHMSGPMKVMDVDIYSNSAIDTRYMDFSNTTIEDIPFRSFNNGQPIFKSSESFVKDFKFPLKYSEYISKFSIRKKSYGKPRGKTSR